MSSRKIGSADSDADGFVVKASENFHFRRLITIPHLNKKQFNALRSGGEIKISVEAFEAAKNLYIKVREKNGDNIL